jgi:nucleoside-diphosphate-sugar epimerase
MFPSHIFLAGASRGVGREIAQILIAQNLKVTAMLRSEAARADLEALRIQATIADALNAKDVEQAMSAVAPIDVVITTIGGLPQDGQRSDYWGNKHLIDAAVQVGGVQKFILVTSIGSGNSVIALSPQVLQALGPVLAEKEQAEQHLMTSGLNYTIIRPGGLKSEPATGQGVLTENPAIAGSIHRADVGQLVCRCLLSERTNNKVFSAVDRQMLYGEPTFEEFVLT